MDSAVRMPSQTRSDLIILSLVWAFCTALTIWLDPFPRDLQAEIALGHQVLIGGNPYAPLNQISDLGYIYTAPRPPGALLVDVPLALVPEQLLISIMVVANVTVLVAITYISLRHSGLPSRWMVLTPLVMTSSPGLQVVRELNLAPLVGVAIVSTWVLSKRRDSFWIGLPLGLAVAMRIYPVWFALVLLVAGRKRVALAAMAVGAILNGVGLLLPAITVDGSVSVLTQNTFLTWTANTSIPGMLSEWLPSTWVALALAVVLICWLLLRRPSLRDGLAVVGPAALLVGPVSWPMYLTAIGPAIADACRRRWVFPSLIVLWYAPWFGPPENLCVGASLAVLVWAGSHPLSAESDPP